MTYYCVLVDSVGNPGLASETSALSHPDDSMVSVLTFPANTLDAATNLYAYLLTQMDRSTLLAWRKRAMRVR